MERLTSPRNCVVLIFRKWAGDCGLGQRGTIEMRVERKSSVWYRTGLDVHGRLCAVIWRRVKVHCLE